MLQLSPLYRDLLGQYHIISRDIRSIHLCIEMIDHDYITYDVRLFRRCFRKSQMKLGLEKIQEMKLGLEKIQLSLLLFIIFKVKRCRTSLN